MGPVTSPVPSSFFPKKAEQVWFCFILWVIGEFVHEGKGSRSGEWSLDSCGYDGKSPPKDDSGESAQLYSKVWEICSIGEPGDKP